MNSPVGLPDPIQTHLRKLALAAAELIETILEDLDVFIIGEAETPVEELSAGVEGFESSFEDVQLIEPAEAEWIGFDTPVVAEPAVSGAAPLVATAAVGAGLGAANLAATITNNHSEFYTPYTPGLNRHTGVKPTLTFEAPVSAPSPAVAPLSQVVTPKPPLDPVSVHPAASDSTAVNVKPTWPSLSQVLATVPGLLPQQVAILQLDQEGRLPRRRRQRRYRDKLHLLPVHPSL